MSGQIAAFIDRDGTIIRDANYLSDPAHLELLPGAAAAIARLNARDIPVIVVTNQSGIARGWLTVQDFEAVRDQLDELLRAEGARVTQTYMCPHLPEITGPCDCRKPGLGLYRQAISDHDLDPGRSLFVGDRWRDAAPGRALGGTAVLLDVESTPAADLKRGREESIEIEGSLADAVDKFLAALPA